MSASASRPRSIGNSAARPSTANPTEKVASASGFSVVSATCASTTSKSTLYDARKLVKRMVQRVYEVERERQAVRKKAVKAVVVVAKPEFRNCVTLSKKNPLRNSPASTMPSLFPFWSRLCRTSSSSSELLESSLLTSPSPFASTGTLSRSPTVGASLTAAPVRGSVSSLSKSGTCASKASLVTKLSILAPNRSSPPARAFAASGMSSALNSTRASSGSNFIACRVSARALPSAPCLRQCAILRMRLATAPRRFPAEWGH